MRRQLGILFVAGVLAFGVLPAGAQVGPPGAGQRRGQEAGRQELERRLQARFGQMIRNQLGLSEEQMRGLQVVMQSFQEERQSLSQVQASLRYRLRDPGLPEFSDVEARGVLQEMIRLQEEELALYKREQERLLTVLNPKQLLLFYRYREDLGRRIQELRQGRGGGMGPGGGVGGLDSGLLPFLPGGSGASPLR